MNFKSLQESVRVWAERNFPGQSGTLTVLGVAEECGELAHAHLKGEQGIRHTGSEIFEKKVDAVGDIVIYLMHYCSLEGIDFEAAVGSAWAEVSGRNWLEGREGGEIIVDGGFGR